MQEDRLQHLMQKAVSGTISREEREELHARMTGADAERIFDALHEMMTAQHGERPLFSDAEAASLLDRINAETQEEPAVRSVFPVIRVLRVAGWAAAACVVATVAFMAYQFMEAPSQPGTLKVAGVERPGQAAAPADQATKVTLTLADGSKVVLDSTDRNIRQQGALAVNSGTGTLTYTENDVQQTEVDNEPVYNTLVTPRGRLFKIVLPDGSRVFLNAASSLRYPTRFSHSQRKVELIGEAYFEVAGDPAHPFIVETGAKTITVLGTTFNVKAYSDESYTQTTLLEGSIMLDPHGEGKARLMKPGEQATLENGRLIIRKTDSREAVAWTTDLFYFSNTNLREVAHQLQRWYNIEVDFASLPEENLYGELPRSTPLPQLLKAIERTTNIKFKMNNNRLQAEQ